MAVQLMFMWLRSDFSARRFENYSDAEEAVFAVFHWAKELNENACSKLDYKQDYNQQTTVYYNSCY